MLEKQQTKYFAAVGMFSSLVWSPSHTTSLSQWRRIQITTNHKDKGPRALLGINHEEREAETREDLQWTLLRVPSSAPCRQYWWLICCNDNVVMFYSAASLLLLSLQSWMKNNTALEPWIFISSNARNVPKILSSFKVSEPENMKIIFGPPAPPGHIHEMVGFF